MIREPWLYHTSTIFVYCTWYSSIALRIATYCIAPVVVPLVTKHHTHSLGALELKGTSCWCCCDMLVHVRVSLLDGILVRGRFNSSAVFLILCSCSIRPILMQSDTLIEKAGFRSEKNSGFLYCWKKLFRSPFFRSSTFRQDVQIGLLDRKSFLKPTGYFTTLQNIRPHHRTAYNSFDADLTATDAAATAAAHSESTWHMPLSARQQRVPSSDGSSACYR